MPNENGLVVMTPSSVSTTGAGSSASIQTDGSVTFNACVSLSLNGVFTTSYTNYMISMSTDNPYYDREIFFRLRSSGSDSATGYAYTQIVTGLASATSATSARFTGRTYGICGWSNEEYGGGADTIYVWGPRVAQHTNVRNLGMHGSLAFPYVRMYDYGTRHRVNTAYDGITFFPETSAIIAGTVTVFGFNQ